MESLRQLGSEDTGRGLVQLLASRQVTDRVLEQTISYLRQYWLSNTQVIEMEASGQCLDPQQESVRLLLPVLRAQSLGERRWCGHCWKLTPDRNLPMCTRCRQYGYCCDEEGESNVVCQKKHWRKGGHREECAALATAITTTTSTTTTTGAAVEDVARASVEDEGKGGSSAGEEHDADCGTVVATCTGGHGRNKNNNKKKGGKKGKRGRR
jgi:hypothetical protein